MSANCSASAPKSVDSVVGAKIVASVTNTGSESVKILKYGTVLDANTPTKSFTITKGGKEVAFEGIKVSILIRTSNVYKNSYAAPQLSIDVDSLDEAAFYVIGAGETVQVTHDVSSLYNFEAVGTGAFKFEPITTFQVVPGDAKISEYKMSPANTLKVTAASVDVEVTKDVAKRELNVHDKRARNACTTSSYSSFIASSSVEPSFLSKSSHSCSK